MTSAQLASRIRRMRLTMGLTQAELAMRVGMSLQTISAYETGRKRILAIRLFAIVVACEWTMVEFFEEKSCEPTDAEMDRLALRMMEGANV